MEKKAMLTGVIFIVWGFLNIVSLAFPWIDISLKFDSPTYDISGMYRVYVSPIFGGEKIIYLQSPTENINIVQAVQPSVILITLSVITVVLSLLVFYLGILNLKKAGLSSLAMLSLPFEKQYERYGSKLITVSALILMGICLLFADAYNYISFLVDNTLLDVNTAKIDILNFGADLPFAGRLNEVYLFEIGSGALMALTINIVIASISIINTISLRRKYSKAWIIRIFFLLIGISSTLLPWAETIDIENTAFQIYNGFSVPYGIIFAAMGIIVLYLIDIIVLNQNKIDNIYSEIYKLELSENEIRDKKNQILFLSRRNSTLKRIILILLFAMFIISIISVEHFMGLYRYFAEHGGNVESRIGLWLNWLSSILLILIWMVTRE